MTFTFTRWFRAAGHCVKAAVFLSQCKNCGCILVFPGEDIICRECREEIVMVDEAACVICGRIMETGDDICGQCLVDPPPFKKHASYSCYRGPLKHLILLYKYAGIEKLKFLFAGYFARSFRRTMTGAVDYIIPVPPDRGRKREFAPMDEVGKILARKLGAELLTGNLVKIKKTLPQAGLKRARRLKNLDGAFKLRDPGRLKGKRLLLIDDIYTTGTTLKKCSRLLARHASEVVALTLARPRDN
jgi:ComF family protein